MSPNNNTSSMSAMSTQAAESLVSTVCYRQISAAFPQLTTHPRDDGMLIFLLSGNSNTKLRNEKDLLDSFLEKILTASVREICRTARVKDTRSGDIDFNNLSEKSKTLQQFLSSSSGALAEGCFLSELPADINHLPESPALSSMLTLIYNDVVELTHQMTVVGRFPPALCKIPSGHPDAKSELPRAFRVDCLLGGTVVASAFAGTPLESDPVQPVIAVHARSLAKILAPHSTSSIDQSLPAQWRHKSFTLEEIEDILIAVGQCIAVQWETSAKNEKAKIAVLALMQTVNSQLRDYLRDQLMLESADKIVGIWRMPRDALTRVAKVGRTWQRSAREIVTKQLKGWDGGYRSDQMFDDFVYRVDSAAKIRLTLERGATLLGHGSAARTGAGEFQAANPENIFVDKSAVDPIRTSQKEWKHGCEEFDRAFEKFESSIVAKLKSVWSTMASDSEAVFSFVEENEILLQRENVAGGLEAELNKLARDVEAKIDESRRQVEQVVQKGASPIARMAAFRNSVAEIAPIAAGCSRVIATGSSENDSVEEKLEEHIKRAQQGIQEALVAWRTEASRRLTAGLPVVVIVTMVQTNKDDVTTSILNAAFDSQMEKIIEEAAELLGLTSSNFFLAPAPSSQSQPQQLVPYEALQLTPEADKAFNDIERIYRAFYRLRQQLVVFNTLTTRQIVPCTRPLFAATLGKCVAAVMGDAAGSPRRTFGPSAAPDLENIVNRFQAALEHAATEWISIRKLHSELGAMVNTLFDVDLIHAQEQWKSVLKDMRVAMESFERLRGIAHTKGKEVEGSVTYTWKRHWDFQLYKALEHQYQRGLAVLNENAASINVELHVKNGQVVFKPGYENLRENYYQRIRDFVNIPNRFKGLANSDFFGEMPGRNAEAVTTVHTKAMDLFARLARVRKQFRDHVAVGLCGFGGSMDLDALVSELVTSHSQWEAGFKLVKERLKRTAQIEDTVKIDCINVNTTPIKAAIEDQLRRLEESLLASLRKSSQKRLSEIDSFVLRAANVVERQPATLEELGEMNKQLDEIKKKLPEIAEMMEEQEGLTKLIRSIGGSSTSVLTITADYSITKSRWDHLQDAMASHSKQMTGSVAKLRSNVESMVNKFVRDVERYTKSWNMHRPKDVSNYKSRSEFVEKVVMPGKDRATEFEELRNSAKDTIEKCDYFGVSGPDMSAFEELEEEVTNTMKAYKFFDEFDTAVEELRQEDWLTFRTRAFHYEDLLKIWSKKFKMDVLNVSEESAAAPFSEKEVNQVQESNGVVAAYIVRTIIDGREITPLLKFVRGDGYLSEHWTEMFRFLEFEKGLTSDALRFGHFLEKSNNIIKRENELKNLFNRALGEVQIRDALQELRSWSLDAKFTLIPPPEGSTQQKIMLITEWKDVLTQVSDFQALLSSLSGSPWFSRFADEAHGFEQRLLNLQEYMQLLNNTQRKWLYLEPLFSRGALPQEQQRFKRVDKEFVGILREVEADPRVMTLAQHDDYGDKLKAILDQIDRCQRALNEFLEQKRDKFPRFYFISDEDLLEILGQSKNPSVIQAHLKKLFAGINSVHFNDNTTEITHMVSSEGEVVPLKEAVSITDPNVEEWLILLDRSMRSTLAELMCRCAAMPIEQMMKSLSTIDAYPSQVLQIASQISFCNTMEDGISKGGGQSAMNSVKKLLQQALESLVGMDYNENLKESQHKEKNVRELKVKSLVMDVIHMIEVADLVGGAKPDEAKWLWQKQLRFYLEDYKVNVAELSDAAQATEFTHKGKRCVVCMADAKFHYSYEYQGNAPKLVHTPLTDTCYLTLTKGMQLGYGGQLFGPAGTGKTESVKALGGGCLGRYVLVFNCDEGIDFKSMSRLFSGIIKCGAWGCFDEFNRLKVDQLSAISQMIQGIQEGLKLNETTCQLLGKPIDLHPASGIFVTLNPAGKNYGGRSKLPDNLKQLFRAVAMSVPDTILIAETMLLSEGFRHAKDVAPRVVEVYRLAKQLLSSQRHYDWGLRPLKAVLRLGGSLIQQRRRGGEPAENRTAQTEAELLVQSLAINTLSKLTFDDVRLFNGIIHDVFPGIPSKQVEYEDLEGALCAAAKSLGLEEFDKQIAKALQLHEAMNQRMGVAIVGPQGSGKTTVLRLLRKAYESLGTKVVSHVMNPKAVPRDKLLGTMDPDTREWNEGILSSAAKKVVKEPSNVRSWVVNDGEVDPVWVESLNSVLDDNRLLTLPTGVRIQFAPGSAAGGTNFIFETHSLQYASPATVSRLGIIFLSEQDVRAEDIVKSFISHRLSDEQRERVTDWINHYLLEAVDLAEDLDAFAVPSQRISLIQACLIHASGAQTKFDFACRIVRALTGYIQGVDKQKELAQSIFDLTEEKPVAPSNQPLDAYFDEDKKKARALSVDSSTAGNNIDILDCAVSNQTPPIPTLESMRILQALGTLVDPPVNFTSPEGLTSFPAFFLVGPEGCGKSVLLQACFDELAQRNQEKAEATGRIAGSIKVVTINCSAQTSASQILGKLQQSCMMSTNAHGKVLRPKDADRLVLCLKSVNLPRPDSYGTVMLHSFLQQLLLYNGFYDSELEWVGIDKIQIVGSMSNSTGRAPVTPRLLGLVNIVYIPHPDQKSMAGVYTALFKALLKTPALKDGRQYDNGKELAQLVTSVYAKVQKRFSGEEYKFCAFSPRDVTTWVLSLLRYDLSQNSLPECLAYEGLRLFSDRLPRVEDRGKAERYLKENLTAVGVSLPEKEADRKLFATWQSEWIAPNFDTNSSTINPSDGVPGSRRLMPITIDQIKAQLEDGIMRYSREFGDLPLNLIPEMLQWTIRIDRAISKTAGHLCVIGRSGMGRRHAVIAAAYMVKIEVVRLKIGRDYTMKQFKNDLKALINRAATGPDVLMLLVEDHHFVDESFLELLNSLIAAGEVPGLFSNEEIDGMVSQIRDDASSSGFQGSMYQFLIRRIQQQLRICLLLDHTHGMFGVRCQSNPAVLTRCTVLWTDTFTTDGLTQLATFKLQETVGSIRSREDSKSKPFDAVYEATKIHRAMIKDKGVPPQDFACLLNSFESIFQSRARASGDAVDRLEQGLNKLGDAESQVSSIRTSVTAKKAEMQKKQAEANEAMTEIQQSMEDSADQRSRAEELQEKLAEEQKEISVKREKVDAELSTIEPKLKEASEAVRGIKSENLSEIKGLRSPPEAVRDVLEGVLALLGIEDSSWQGMRKFLGDRGVKDQILSFDAKSVSNHTRESVAKLIHQKENSFKPEIIARASAAAAPLASWTKANLEFCVVLERVGPLRKLVDDLEENARRGKEKLEKLQKKLKHIDEKVAKLRTSFEKKISEANELQDGCEKAEKQLDTASSLLDKLTGERDRWREQTAEIRADQEAMPRRALACAAFTTYLGSETEDVRAATMKEWADRLKLSKTTTGDLFSSFMRTESELLKYKSEGLPGDSLSIENAVVMLDAPRVPLIVDPAGQAQEWLVNHFKESDTNVEVASSGDDRFSHIVELAIRFGKTLLITDVDRIEPLLFNVLRKDLQSLGPKKVVQLGTKTVDWQDNFRLFLFTRSAADLHLPPDADALVTLVNFSVTRLGLEAQLLGKTIQHEQPQLEVEKVELLKKEESLKMDLAKLEESLLRDLATSHGNLLENTALISSLNTIKAQAKTIMEALDKSKQVSKDLDQKRNVYRPLAAASSTLYFLFGDLQALSRMYQFSLSSFLTLFEATLASGAKLPEGISLDEKIKTLVADMTRRSFFYVSRGLFKADRVSFAVHILHGLYPEEFPEEVWNVLCGRAAGSTKMSNVAANAGESPAEGSLETNNANNKVALINVNVPSWSTANPSECAAGLRRVAAVIPDYETRWKLNDDSGWKSWMQSSQPHVEIFSRMPSLCDAFLFMSIFLRSQMQAAMAHATRDRLKINELALTESIEQLIGITNANVPTLLITSSGADPSLELQSAAYSTVGRQRLTQIALGGGQTDEALSQLRRCAQAGDWLILKNVHLVLGWAGSVLEKELGSTLQNADPEFRLWLTTEAHDAFPTVLLRSSLKMTFESPPGVRSNMLRTISTLPPAPGVTQLGSSLVFALTWFHAILSERRTYIPQGWTKMYEFTLADARAAADVLYALSSTGNADWAFVRGMIHSAIYGGRLDAPQDVRVLSVFLDRVFRPDVVVDKRTPLFGKLTVSPNLSQGEKDVQNALSDIDPPAIFSLPDNADIVVQELAAIASLSALKTLGQGLQSSGAISADAVKAMLAPVISEFWRASSSSSGESSSATTTPLGEIPRVPQIGEQMNSPSRNSLRRSSSIRASSSLGLLAGAQVDPLEVFLCSEISLIVTLMTDVVAMMQKATQVVDGLSLAGPDLLSVAPALGGFTTPDKWLDRMPGPESLQQWCAVLKLRAARVADWHMRFLGAKTLLNEPLDLSDLVRPQTFLNALRQHTARKTGNELVRLTLNSSTSSSGNQLAGSNGKTVPISLSGKSLSIQGGQVGGGGRLAAVSKQSASTAPFVNLQLAWVIADANDQTHAGTVKVPLYSDQSRETLVADVYLPCESNTADDWVLRGTALILVPPVVPV